MDSGAEDEEFNEGYDEGYMDHYEEYPEDEEADDYGDADATEDDPMNQDYAAHPGDGDLENGAGGVGDDDGHDHDLDHDQDDPVVFEMDICIARHLKNVLHVLQYPTRSMPFDEAHHPQVGRFKSKSGQLELDIPLATNDIHYNHQTGMNLAEGLDDKPLRTAYDRELGVSARDKLLDSITLSSAQVPLSSYYMVGVVHDGELHLTEVTSCLQMRPNLKYLDKIDEKKKQSQSRIAAEEAKEEGREPEAKMIQLQVRSGDKNAMQRATALQKQKEIDDEPWQSLKIEPQASHIAMNARDELLGDSSIDLTVVSNKQDYLDEFRPKVPTEEIRDERGQIKITRGMAMNDLQSATLLHKIKAVLINAQIIDFTRLYEMVGAGHTEEEVIVVLEQVALLVRGTWILRSELIYTDRPRDARRYLLGLFRDHEFVERKPFADRVLLPPSIVGSFLQEIANLHPQERKWGLKVAPDRPFMQRHPELVKRHYQLISEEMEQALAAMGIGDKRGTQKSRSASHFVSPTTGRVPAPAAAAETVARSKPSGSTPRADIQTFLDQLIDKIFLANGVCSLEYVQHEVAAKKSEAGSMLEHVENSAELAARAVEARCTRVSGRYVLRTLNNPGLDQVRDVVVKLFSRQELIKKQDVAQAFKSQYGSDLPTAHYNKAMKELANSGGGGWTLKMSPAQP